MLLARHHGPLSAISPYIILIADFWLFAEVEYHAFPFLLDRELALRRAMQHSPSWTWVTLDRAQGHSLYVALACNSCILAASLCTMHCQAEICLVCWRNCQAGHSVGELPLRCFQNQR